MRMMRNLPLERKGAQISGGGLRWQMVGVEGPLPYSGGKEDCQYFQIATSSEEVLLVYRAREERGMRELFLLEVRAGRASY